MTTLAYRRWQWRCNAANTPSRRAAERFGFTKGNRQAGHFACPA